MASFGVGDVGSRISTDLCNDGGATKAGGGKFAGGETAGCLIAEVT